MTLLKNTTIFNNYVTEKHTQINENLFLESEENIENKMYTGIIKNILEVLPRFELGLLDSESRVLTVTP